MKPADLRSESGGYAEAVEHFALSDDLSAERVPYDEQVIYCQNRADRYWFTDDFYARNLPRTGW